MRLLRPANSTSDFTPHSDEPVCPVPVTGSPLIHHNFVEASPPFPFYSEHHPSSSCPQIGDAVTFPFLLWYCSPPKPPMTAGAAHCRRDPHRPDEISPPPRGHDGLASSRHPCDVRRTPRASLNLSGSPSPTRAITATGTSPPSLTPPPPRRVAPSVSPMLPHPAPRNALGPL
jgi:hypothetical protein